jgi:DNA repair protein RadC
MSAHHDGNSRLFTVEEAQLLDSARTVLAAGMARVKGRLGLFPTTRASAEALAAREGREALTALLQLRIGALPHEQAVAVLFDAQGRLITIEDFPEGELTACAMSYRTLAGWVCRHGAQQVLVAHNHPSGECSPSRQDETACMALESWLRPMGCFLTDSLVITVDDWTSIKGNWSC